MIRTILFAFVGLLTTIGIAQSDSEKETIDAMLVAWHKAAADADFDAYFGMMTNMRISLGLMSTLKHKWESVEVLVS